MKRILENMDRKKIALITAALAVLLLSVFVISKAAADPANHTQTLDKIAGGVSGLLEKGEQLLNQFIESIAVMFVTSCLIPIAVLMFVLWLVRVMFEVQINVPRELPKKISRRLPGGKKKPADGQKTE